MRPLIQEIATPHTPESLVEQLRGEPGVVLLRSALFDSSAGALFLRHRAAVSDVPFLRLALRTHATRRHRDTRNINSAIHGKSSTD